MSALSSTSSTRGRASPPACRPGDRRRQRARLLGERRRRRLLARSRGFAASGAGRCAERQRDGERGALARRALHATLPPCSSTSSRTSARPMPVPSWLRAWCRARGGSARTAAAARRRGCRRRCRATDERGVPRAPRRATRIAARRGELERVGEQVEHDLLPHLAVDVAAGQRRAVDVEPSPARSTAERNAPAELGGVAAPGRSAAIAGCSAAGLQAGEVEQRVDQPQQPQRVALAVSSRSRWRRQRRGAGERVLERPEQQRQRRAELVRDVREELGLRPVELGQRLGPARAPPRRRLATARWELGGEQPEELAVALVAAPGAGGRRRRAAGAADGQGTVRPALPVCAAPRSPRSGPGERAGPPGSARAPRPPARTTSADRCAPAVARRQRATRAAGAR